MGKYKQPQVTVANSAYGGEWVRVKRVQDEADTAARRATIINRYTGVTTLHVYNRVADGRQTTARIVIDDDGSIFCRNDETGERVYIVRALPEVV